MDSENKRNVRSRATPKLAAHHEEVRLKPGAKVATQLPDWKRSCCVIHEALSSWSSLSFVQALIGSVARLVLAF